MEIRLLGPMKVVVAGRSVPLPEKPRTLLAMLAVEPNRTLSAERLIDGLWGEAPPRTANKTLQTYVFQLRRALGSTGDVGPAEPRIETDGAGYQLRIDVQAIDARRFEQLVDGARVAMPGDPRLAADRLAEGLALWRGPALADFVYAPFAEAEVERLEELRSTALESMAQARLALGEHEAIIGDLRRSVAELPFREGLWASLLLALYRSGRKAEAMLAFRDAETALRDELGIEPGPQLQDVAQRIRDDDPSLEYASAVAASTASLPPRLTSFIGRESEIELARQLLEATRLLTITGAGGSGKTRLALELAGAVGADYEQVRFVDLSPVVDRADALISVARALGVATSTARGPLGAIGAWLADRHALVVLDNVEQLEPPGMLVADLLSVGGGTDFIVTSRSPLRIRGEQQLPLAPLQLPDPKAPALEEVRAAAAVALFLARGLAVDPTFQLDDSNVRDVAELCRRLDGLPLAIELAAVRIRTLRPAAMLERLGSGLDLTGAHDLPDRHMTLRRTLGWSIDLLPAEDRQRFARLGVFAGGWTLEAAEAVAADDQDVLTSIEGLVEQSLVHGVPSTRQTRFTMLETVRAFARELLEAADDGGAVRDRHAAFFVTGAERNRQALFGAGLGAADEWFLQEIDNLRTAYRRLAAGGDVVSGLRLGTAMLTFAQLHLEYVGEVRGMIEHFLGLPRVNVDGHIAANALGAAAQLALWQMDSAVATTRADESRRYFEELGDPIGIADQLAVAGYAAIPHDRAEATRRLEAALERYRSVHHPGAGFAMLGLASVAMEGGDAALARRRLDGIGSADSVPFAPDRAVVLVAFGRLHQLEGDLSAARASYMSALTIWQGLGASGELSMVLGDFALLAIDEGDPITGLTLGMCAARLGVDDVRFGHRFGSGRDPVKEARALVGPEEADRASDEVAAMTLQDATALAVASRDPMP